MKTLLTIFLIVLGLGSVHGQTNLITNGSFETAPGSALGTEGYYTQNVSGTTTYTINDWTFGRISGTGGNPRFHWYTSTDRPSWTNLPQDGSWAVQLNSDSFTDRIYVQQTVNLTAGQLYQLSFYFIDESAFNDQVGITVSEPTLGVAVDYTYTSTGTDTWQNVTLSFVAPATTTYTLRFTDLVPSGNNQQNVMLDNVSLYAIPEPATYLSGILLAGLAFATYRRRKNSPAT